jgi:ketosteroid isomerase-like protein
MAKKAKKKAVPKKKKVVVKKKVVAKKKAIVKAPNVDALAKRVQMLEDKEAIRDLKALYAEICDDKYNPDRMMPLFTEDAIWDGGPKLGRYEGKKAIREFFTGVSGSIIFTVHYFVQPTRLTVTGNTAKGSWYMWMAGTMGNGKAGWLAGTEDEVYVKVKGKWLFKEIKLNLLFATPYEAGWHKDQFGVL